MRFRIYKGQLIQVGASATHPGYRDDPKVEGSKPSAEILVRATCHQLATAFGLAQWKRVGPIVYFIFNGPSEAQCWSV